ncbi:hypothetical protein CMV_007812 [Castanea mollissima]|uniref:Uncharacterized protein n=1 Tax=Castanea mollissima TaxID=60419 RepID=A0A8J4RU51_9ROSI|nr:hypothetical protein CMV_007812 [Castanea mollissima]
MKKNISRLFLDPLNPTAEINAVTKSQSQTTCQYTLQGKSLTVLDFNWNSDPIRSDPPPPPQKLILCNLIVQVFVYTYPGLRVEFGCYGI